MMLDRGRTVARTSKAPEAMIKMMYGGGAILNPMSAILRYADTLKLTNSQADSIAAINRWYTTRVDSIWAPVAKFLADLPDNYDQGLAYEKYVLARRAQIDLMIKVAPTIKAILKGDQFRLLPSYATANLDT